MLEAIQRSGDFPPLILVHGLYGVMPIGHALARVLGPDQPLYVINAAGFDGARDPLGSVPEMVTDYVAQIGRAVPAGPYLIGGICSGSVAALEIARTLVAAGHQVGRVLLIDPPALPYSSDDRLSQMDPALQPGVMRRLQEQAVAELQRYAALYEFLPYDARDPARLRMAASVGVACMMAFFRHKPLPFALPVELIVSDRRASGYVGAALPWQSILTGPRWMHILPGQHGDMFGAQRDAVFRLVSFYLETALEPESAESDPGEFEQPEQIARAALGDAAGLR